MREINLFIDEEDALSIRSAIDDFIGYREAEKGAFREFKSGIWEFSFTRRSWSHIRNEWPNRLQGKYKNKTSKFIEEVARQRFVEYDHQEIDDFC